MGLLHWHILSSILRAYSKRLMHISEHLHTPSSVAHHTLKNKGHSYCYSSMLNNIFFICTNCMDDWSNEAVCQTRAAGGRQRGASRISTGRQKKAAAPSPVARLSSSREHWTEGV